MGYLWATDFFALVLTKSWVRHCAMAWGRSNEGCSGGRGAAAGGREVRRSCGAAMEQHDGAVASSPTLCKSAWSRHTETSVGMSGAASQPDEVLSFCCLFMQKFFFKTFF